jgi:hypothetical protein
MNELLQSIKADLLSRRLLPALVAVCVGLLAAVAYAASGGGGASTPPPAPPSSPSAAAPATSALPLSVAPANPHEAVAETPGGAHFQSKAHERDPFTPIAGAAKAAGSGASGSKGKGTGGSSTSTKTGSSSKGATTGGSAPAPATKPPAKAAPKPVHVGLTSTQSYEVALSLTSQGGNLDSIESLKRLGGLPSEGQPLLVYVGVLEGGHDALFVVQPGTVVSGPGGCTPGPTDCEILSLAANQIESLAVSTSGGDSNVALFAVTAIKVDNHRTVAAANRARREAAASGRALLEASTLPALALFEYRPTVGVVVDLRDLAVGGEK